ncbi:MAG: archaeosortase/exosortase family protein [Fibrobacter sp.]|nr:archaeosortase/exosortase family protein [Fibrobacter sp.]
MNNRLLQTNRGKIILFLSLTVISLLLFGNELKDLIGLVLKNSAYTHIGVIPIVSGYFLWWSRDSFKNENGHGISGFSILSIGVIITLLSNFIKSNDPVLSLAIKSAGSVFAIYGAFVVCWGGSGFKKVLFPLIILILAVPMPKMVLDGIIWFLQWGSAVMVDGLYILLGQAYVREGVEFHLNKISISIAPECSGIRSTMALIITGAVAVEMFLKTNWLKTCMLLLVIPFSLLKNAIRIVTITMLAEYIDTAFLTDSFLHHSGGIFFYLIVLAIYFPFLLFLTKVEKNWQKRKTVFGEAGS